MHYGAIKNCDIANGTGVRVSLFVSGCRNCCEDCFQPETWNFAYGSLFTENIQDEIIKMLSYEYISGLTVLGGEPFEPENQRELLGFLRRIKNKFPDKSIWVFSGFTLEEMYDPDCRACCEVTQQLLETIDVLVDGRFVRELKSLSLRFRGSSNQRIIDLNKTRKTGKTVLWNET